MDTYQLWRDDILVVTEQGRRQLSGKVRQPPYLNFIQKSERLLCIYVKHYTLLMDLMAEPLSPMSILFADHKVI
jgi:hypothetical protein